MGYFKPTSSVLAGTKVRVSVVVVKATNLGKLPDIDLGKELEGVQMSTWPDCQFSRSRTVGPGG